MNPRPIIYVAGPFRGKTPWDVECNIRAAEMAALDVAKVAGIPLCPHTMYRFFDKSLPDAFWLDATMALLEKCDAIYLCPGWEESEGSISEQTKAIEIGLLVFESFAQLKRWIAKRILG